MSKVSIVYWSGTGNTAMMAGSIADGVAAAGGEAEAQQEGQSNRTYVHASTPPHRLSLHVYAGRATDMTPES